MTWREEQRPRALAEMQQMTLSEAVELLATMEGHWCACPGPPVCCWERVQHAERVKRAAHIAVKQVAELAARRDEWRPDGS